MTKNTPWTEALAAYDRELDLLEETRNAYGQYLEHAIKTAAASADKRSKGVPPVSLRRDESATGPSQDVAEWRLRGSPSIAGLVVQIFSSGAGGGSPGSVLVVLRLDADALIAKEFNFDALATTLSEAAAALPGGPHDPTKHPEETSEFRYLRVSAVDVGADDVAEQLASRAASYLDAALKLANRAAEPMSTDAYRWARLRLLEVRASFTLPATSESGKPQWEAGEGLDEWEGGRYLGVSRGRPSGDENDDFWICALPSGDLVFAGYGPYTKVKSRWDSLLKLSRGKARTFNDKRGATIFEASAVEAMAKKGETGKMRDAITALFTTFLAPK